MRFGRIILLASLAQLLGLSALAAALSELPSFSDVQTSEERGLSLLPQATSEVTLSFTHSRPSTQAVLAVTALAITGFKHSVWMVAPAVRTVAVPRPRRHTLLRC